MAPVPARARGVLGPAARQAAEVVAAGGGFVARPGPGGEHGGGSDRRGRQLREIDPPRSGHGINSETLTDRQTDRQTDGRTDRQAD